MPITIAEMISILPKIQILKKAIKEINDSQIETLSLRLDSIDFFINLIEKSLIWREMQCEGEISSIEELNAAIDKAHGFIKDLPQSEKIFDEVMYPFRKLDKILYNVCAAHGLTNQNSSDSSFKFIAVAPGAQVKKVIFNAGNVSYGEIKLPSNIQLTPKQSAALQKFQQARLGMIKELAAAPISPSPVFEKQNADIIGVSSGEKVDSVSMTVNPDGFFSISKKYPGEKVTRTVEGYKKLGPS